MTSPLVCIIVVAFNSGADLQRALDGAAAQTYPNLELILWDNASTDGAAAEARLPAFGRRIICERNIGFAGGNNAALQLTEAPLVALLNPDAVPAPDWVARLVETIDAHPQAASVASLQRMAGDPGRLDGAGDVYAVAGIPYRGGFGQRAPAHLPTGSVFGPCGAAALYRRDVVLALGGFEEDFFCYCEDVDLAARLRLAGWTSRFAPTAVVDHVGSASTGRRSRFAVYHGTRNRLWTFVRTMPLALWPAALPAHVGMTLLLTALSIGHGRVAFTATLEGLRDGIIGLPRAWAARRKIMATRKVSLAAYARALTWSPVKLARRGIDIRPDKTGRPVTAASSDQGR